MTLRSLLFRPNWQHRDAAVRLAAVIGDDDPQLLDALPAIAREDSDARVRLAALRRAADAGLAQAMAKDDADADVRSKARALWLDMLCGAHDAAPDLDDRLRLLSAQDEAAVLAHVACHGQEAVLRAAALKRIDDPAVLLERAIHDDDEALRLATLERIDDESRLERVVAQARRSDRQVISRARARLLDMRIARGDMETITTHAAQLCAQLERLVRDPRDLDAVATAVQQDWQALAAHVPAELAQRHAHASAIVAAMRNPDALLAQREHAAAVAEIGDALDELHARASAADAAANAAALGEELTALAQRYMALPSDIETVQQRREAIEDRLSRLTSLLAGMAAPAAGSDAEAPAIQAAETDQDSIPIEGGDPDVAVAQARFVSLVASARSDAARQQEKQAALLGDLETALGKLEEALEAGNSASARDSNAQIDSVRQALADVPRGLARRLARAQGEFRKISNWQRWSSNERRQQLCKEVETLPGAGLHPDALATRLRELQAQWRELATTADKPDHLEHRFRRACRRALEPAKGYFDKRAELRAEKTAAVTEVINQVEAALAGDEVPDLAGMRKQAISALRGLDDIDPRQRGMLARKARALLDDLDKRIAAHESVVGDAKDALIAAARALTADGLQRDATRSVRELQARWKAAGNGSRRRDQAQWKEFRAAIDAVFATLDEQRAERRQADAQVLTEAGALCDALQALADSGVDDPAETARINREWRALAVRDDGLARRFSAAQAKIKERAASRRREQDNARFTAWQQRYALLRQWESGGAPDLETWQALPGGTIGTQLLEQRLADLQAGAAAGVQDGAAFRDIVLQLEQLADIESPEEDSARRMELRVQQLAGQMTGDQAPPLRDQLATLLEDWLALGPLPGPLVDYDKRLARALDTLLASD